MFDYLDYRNKIPLGKILETIEDIHPFSPKYSLYWINNIKRKQIEGKWVQYKGEWKWIPGPIFQYIQLWNIEIKQLGTKSKGKVIGRPRLRDIEWIKGYVHAVSRGFSGFEKDENYSSHRVLINPDRDDIISTLSNEVKSTLYKPSGELKEYKDALQYLYEYLPDNYGKPLYLNEAKNVIDIECRNIGKDLWEETTLYYEHGPGKIKDVKIGDRIFGDDGKLTTVTNRFDFNDQVQFEIKLKKVKEPILCGLGHQWLIRTIAGDFVREFKDFKDYKDHVLLPYKKSIKGKMEWSQIEYIKEIGIKPSVCITVDNESKLFIAGDFIVTHNTMITGNFAGHNFLTDGITDFDEYVENKNKPEGEKVVYTTQTLISAIDGKYVNNLVKHLKTGLEYLPGKKQVGETLFPPPLSKTIRGSWRVGEDVKNEYDYKVGNKWEVRGTKSGFNLRSFMDNPFAANGLRYGFGVIDEIGFMGIIEEVLGQLEECTTVDGEKYGTIWMTGTGGDFKDGGATHNVRKVFEDPKAYNCLEFDDIFENSGKKIGFFVPAWMALDEFRDEFGNVNKQLALKKLNREREEKKKAKTKQAYYNLLPTKPLSWTEAFLSTSRQRFPSNLIEEQIKILTEPELKKHEVGKLMFNAEGKLEFIHDFNLDPYREYPVKEFLPGAVEIFERPQDSEDAPLIPFRYIIGVDPYKYDVSKEIQSIGSCIVFDRLTRRIVAEYSGRPDTTNIFYETCRKLCLFYNATLMYESNFTNMYHYFEEKRSLHLLADTPMTLRDRNTWKINTNTSKGIIATTPINERGLEFIENYLMESLSENSDLTRTSTVRSLGLLRELRGWTPDNNTDRISAFSMVMWYDITLGSLSNQEEVRERNQKKFGEYFNQFRKNPYNMSKTDMMFEKHF